MNIFSETILLKISSESRKPSSFESKERNTLREKYVLKVKVYKYSIKNTVLERQFRNTVLEIQF